MSIAEHCNRVERSWRSKERAFERSLRKVPVIHTIIVTSTGEQLAFSIPSHLQRRRR